MAHSVEKIREGDREDFEGKVLDFKEVDGVYVHVSSDQRAPDWGAWSDDQEAIEDLSRGEFPKGFAGRDSRAEVNNLIETAFSNLIHGTAEENRERSLQRIQELRSEIEEIDRAVGSGEFSNRYSIFENQDERANEMVQEREEEIRGLEARIAEREPEDELSESEKRARSVEEGLELLARGPEDRNEYLEAIREREAEEDAKNEKTEEEPRSNVVSDISAYEPNDQTAGAMEAGQESREREVSFENATTIVEIIEIINSIDGLEGTMNRFYAREELLQRLNRVLVDHESTRILTRTAGFREAVERVLNREEQEAQEPNHEGLENPEAGGDDIGDPEADKETLDPEVIAEMRDAFAAAEEEEEKVSKWAWLKERAKGFMTMGWWEVHQAEKFRSASKVVAAEMEEMMGNHIVELEASSETEERVSELREGMEGSVAEGDRDLLGEVLQEIEEMPEGENKLNAIANLEHINKILKTTESRLHEELEKKSKVQGYRGFAGGEVLTPARLARVKSEIFQRCVDMQRRQVRVDQVGLAAVFRKNLDRGWWKRYVAGAVELATGAALMHVVVSKIGAAFTTAEVPAAIANAGNLETLNMTDTVWQTTKDWLINNGVNNPTNEQVMNATKVVLDSNGIFEPAWEAAQAGEQSSRLLAQGTELVINKHATLAAV